MRIGYTEAWVEVQRRGVPVELFLDWIDKCNVAFDLLTLQVDNWPDRENPTFWNGVYARLQSVWLYLPKAFCF